MNLSTAPTFPQHPGQVVRDTILAPKGLSVLAAAKLVGVGRPAFSNFVNGNAAVSSEMASRIEVTFGVPAQLLLDAQAAYDAAMAKTKGLPAAAKRYVVPLLAMKANDIEDWVDHNIVARSRLAVFLRTLVNSTGNNLTKVDFPGNGDAERPGWDGQVEAQTPTQWIPEGLSGWEFGTNQDPKTKAEGDFTKSVDASTQAEREDKTFVFVTPRRWAGKQAWIKAKKAAKLWKDVRAYDASDLEQWLEQSIPGQVWLANETRRPSKGARSLDQCWFDWSQIANPPLVGSLFVAAIDEAKRAMTCRLSSAPEKPIVIAADSVGEALAFLAQLFGPAGGDSMQMHRDRVVVFDQPGTLPELALGAKDFVAVASTPAVERELGPFASSMHCVVICPRNAANTQPDVVLEPLQYDAFQKSLEEMGLSRDEIDRYSKESGRSLTVLVRRMTDLNAIRTPNWAADHQLARQMVPFLFTGAWNSSNASDQTVLTLLSGDHQYSHLEATCQRMVGLHDAPLWSVGTYRGVVSKIDLLFAVAPLITSRDLINYFDVAKLVLSEDDPKLDLPEDKRWAAAIYGKSREFSGALRNGISESLVLLAVHGNSLFQQRLGIDCQAAAEHLVRELLTPLKTRILEANDHDLTAYAEAAPGEFLAILQADLETDSPECFGLLRPADTGFGGGCPRTGLLWALEGLAWNPVTLPQAVLVLARLAEVEINDNWANKPIASLKSIFRPWVPQTAAGIDARVQVINLLVARFPRVAWDLCIDFIYTGGQTGDFNHKPRWRNDAYGYGEPHKTAAPINDFIRPMVELVLDWPTGYSRDMLCDLIMRLQDLSPDHQVRVWHLVNNWVQAGATDDDKAVVREKIRVTVLSRRARIHAKRGDFAEMTAAAKAVYVTLEPADIISKHAWLFKKTWVEESADELSQEVDFQKRDERLKALRVTALREVFEVRQIEGILQISDSGEAASLVGWLLVQEVLQDADIVQLLIAAAWSSQGGLSWNRKNLIQGVLRGLDDEGRRHNILQNLQDRVSNKDFVTYLMHAPFSSSTWQIVGQLEEEHRAGYWNEVIPDWMQSDASDEAAQAVEMLLRAQRPRAAFHCVHGCLESVAPELLCRVLTDINKEGKDLPGQYRLEHHYVGQAFERIGSSNTLTLEQKAVLEFVYIEILGDVIGRRQGPGVPNLELYVEQHPELFVQAICWAFRRRDEGEDAPEMKPPAGQEKEYAERGYRLLNTLQRIPGHDESGQLKTEKLAAWIGAVRTACTAVSRHEIADEIIGKLLSTAPARDDGGWPCEPVLNVLEQLHSMSMTVGVRMGLINSVGATLRDEGGNHERAKAAKYRNWAAAIQYSHPFVATNLFMKLADTYDQYAKREDADAGVRRLLET